MLSNLLCAFGLMAICIVIQTMGLIAVFGRIDARLGSGDRDYWKSLGILTRIAAWATFLHLLQIVAWALLYVFGGMIPDFASAAYFSAVTYGTVGYGDIVPAEEWRLVSAVESLTGILMFGLSIGMFVAIAAKIFVLNRQNLKVPRPNTD